ncbi:uncharacterized protein LOC135935418 isoform X2 [Cloeon dipterum]|uniref:uncharacterized protein LOC135935418 isoform X2 n=1 Tax=Cloeon dipterum TaxID=197152 RepID=UPI00321FEA3F
MWSNRTLAKVATYGAIILVSGAFYLKFRIEDRLKDQPYFKTAFHHLQQHPGAGKYLGKPISMGRLNLEDAQNNFCYENKAQFQVDVRGPNGKGTYYFWSEFDDDNKVWVLVKSELELSNDPDRRLVIKKLVV